MAAQTDAKDPFKDIFEQATDQAVELARERAAIPKAAASVSRERACLIGLLVTAPLFALLLVANVWEISPLDLITPNPSPEVARQQVQVLLDGVVQGIEGYRHDYASLPKELVQVGIPARGSWTYTPRPGGRYQVVGSMYGQVLTFDSPERTVEREHHR